MSDTTEELLRILMNNYNERYYALALEEKKANLENDAITALLLQYTKQYVVEMKRELFQVMLLLGYLDEEEIQSGEVKSIRDLH